MSEPANKWALAIVYGSLVLAVAWSATNGKPSHPRASEEQRSRDYLALVETWPAAPSYDVTFQALRPISVHDGQTGRAVFDVQDDYWGLPRTDGYELVDLYCTACHSLQVVMQQRASYDRWQTTLKWMTDTQNMAPLPAEDEVIILSYLADHFGQ